MKPKSLEIFIPGPAGRLEAKYYKIQNLVLQLQSYYTRTLNTEGQ